jgi:O-antigen ligase
MTLPTITQPSHPTIHGTARTTNPVSIRISSIILFAVVVLAPLPFGSAGPLPVTVWCVALGIALCTASLRGLDHRHLGILAGVAAVVAAYGLVLHEQLAARTFFNALPDQLWQAASDALGSELPSSPSMVRDQPLLALGAPLAAILCLLVSFIVCVDRRRANQLLVVVSWSGSAYAAYGIAAFMIDPGKVLWMKKLAYFNVLTATFTGRNTAAVYFGACAIVWLLLLLERVRQRLPAAMDLSLSVIGQSLGRPGRRTTIGLAAFLACLVAMFLTGSRAGIMLSLLAGVGAAGLLMARYIPLDRRSVQFLLAAACVLLVVTQLLGAGVLERFESEGLHSGGRPATYRSTEAIIEEHPWLGTGLGTFTWVYPAYRTSAWTSWGTWDHAHSTPLEIAAEMGVPLAGVVITAWIGIFAILGFGLRTRKRDQIIVIAALAIAGLGITHSMIDFSLQISGFAMVVFSLVGAGLAQSFRVIRSRSPADEKRS